jgi:hypothetical protein
MSILTYKKERNIDFFNKCEEIRRLYQSQGKYIPVCEIAELAAETPAASFYIHEKEYVKIILKMKNNPDMRMGRSAKNEMYGEIFKLYLKIKLSNKDKRLSISAIGRMIAQMPAKKFYLTGKSAANLYYRLIKNNPG